MGNSLQINTARLIEDLKRLSTFGRAGNGVNRRSLTETDLESRAWLCDRMRAAGMEAGIDGAGNVVGRTPHSRRILIGSHTDTVPNGGWLDGALGVIYGLEIGRALMESPGSVDTGIEVMSFIDEEGRFTPIMGSRVFCGEIREDELAELRSAEGASFSEARCQAGLSDKPINRLDPDIHVAYLEAHIEQGPVLDNRQIRIGVVTGIVGASQYRISFHGQTNHAGTTPMSLRSDAAGAMFEFMGRFKEYFNGIAGADTTWTCNEVRTEPRAGNVISNLAEFSIHYRDLSSEILARLDRGVEDICREAASGNNVTFDRDKTVELVPTVMDKQLIDRIHSAAIECGVSSHKMPSGAGHDAMIIGRYIPAGMLFIPSIGGLSHDTEEDSHEEDIRIGAEVFARAVSNHINHLECLSAV